jgi:MFS family permease
MGWWPSSKVKAIAAEQGVGLLRNGAFSRLWGSQILSQVAQNLLNFALIIRVFELAQHTRFANVSVALLVLSFGVPSIFFAAAAGIYVDHWNRKKVLIVANIVRAVLVLGYLFFEQNLIMVLLLSFLISTATQFFAPAEAASIPVLVGERQLLKANSLFIFTMYASFIFGYSGSAPVIAWFGPHGPYIVTAVMFGLATMLVTALPDIKAKSADRVKFGPVVRRTGSEILSNWRVIRSNRKILNPIVFLTITQTCVGILIALAPALSQTLLHVPIQGAAHVLILPVGAGMVIGVAFLSRLVKRFGMSAVTKIGLLAGGATLVLVAASSYFYASNGSGTVSFSDAPVLAGLIFVLGFATSSVSAAAQTMLQENTTDDNRGRIFGALNMMINIASTLPIMFAGILADLFGVTTVLAVLGFAIFVYSLRLLYPKRFTVLA